MSESLESMHVQTRPRFILSWERILRNGVRTHVNSKGKISTGDSEEGGTSHGWEIAVILRNFPKTKLSKSKKFFLNFF